MKKMFVFAFATMLSVCLLADDGTATIVVPCSPQYVKNNSVVYELPNGDTETFAYIQFSNSEELETASFISSYSQNRNYVLGRIKSAYNGLGMKTKEIEAQAQTIIAQWESVVNRLILDAIARQQKLDKEAIEAAKGLGEGASAEVANLTSTTSARIQSWSSSFSSQLATITSQNATSIETMASYINSSRTELQTKMTELESKYNALKESKDTTALIENLKQQIALVKRNSDEIASLKIAISKLSANKGGSTPAFVIDSNAPLVSNELVRISNWLCSTNVGNKGRFAIPPDPVWGDGLPDGFNIQLWMARLGVIPYLSQYAQESDFYNEHYVWGESFNAGDVTTWGDGSVTTNTWASFAPPTNWIDNVTIIYTNGYYMATASNSATKVATTFIGTDGSSATTTNTVTFAAMEDSNVKVSVTTNATGVLIKFGVYWK